MNQKGGAPSNHWLKVTRRNQNGNDINVEIIDDSAKTAICTPTASGPTFYTSFDDFVKDESNDTTKPLLLQLAGDNTKNFANPFELSSLTTITEDNINWTNPVSC